MLTTVLNGFLQRLHKRLNQKDLDREQKRRIVNRVIKDMDEINLFTEDNGLAEEEWQQLERTSDVIFSRATTKEKIEAVRKIKIEELRLASDQRIEAKRKEILANDPATKKRLARNSALPISPKKRKYYYDEGRFGRSPLHEAVAMKDIAAIKKYAKSGEYADFLDNNHHTPLQMARYGGYEEAIKILSRK